MHGAQHRSQRHCVQLISTVPRSLQAPPLLTMYSVCTAFMCYRVWPILHLSATLGSFVLVVVVDLVVPEQRLVSITPEEVLRANVLVWIFDSFLQGR